MAVGLTQPQLGGCDSYMHGHLVGVGNARVLVQTCLVVTALLFSVNYEIVTTVDAVGTFVIWLEYLLVPVNAPIWLIFHVYLFDELFIFT